jgi:hypothetical protein
MHPPLTESDRSILKHWAAFKQRRRLPTDLDVAPEAILCSPELKARVLQLAEEEREDQRRRADAERGRRLTPFTEDRAAAAVDRAIDAVQEAAREELGIPSLWMGRIGLVDPENRPLLVYAVVPTRADAARLRDGGAGERLRDLVLAAFEAQRIRNATIEDDAVRFFSQQECNETAGGSWYIFFK